MVGNECDCVLCYVLLLHFGILASSFLACKMRGCKPRRMYKEINRQRRPMMMTTTGAREKIGMVNERRDKIRRNNPIWLLCIFPMCSSNLFFLFLLFCCCLFICWTYMHITYNDGGIISMNLILCSFRTKAASKRHKLKYLLKIFRAVFITCAWLGIGNCVFHLTRKLQKKRPSRKQEVLHPTHGMSFERTTVRDSFYKWYTQPKIVEIFFVGLRSAFAILDATNSPIHFHYSIIFIYGACSIVIIQIIIESISANQSWAKWVHWHGLVGAMLSWWSLRKGQSWSIHWDNWKKVECRHRLVPSSVSNGPFHRPKAS